MKMPGVLELARDVFKTNVRMAMPDYIGVREPQFTAGVGLLQFAYRNAKIQGKDLGTSVVVDPEQYDQRQVTKQAEQPKEKKKKESKIAHLFNRFFE